MFDAYKIVRKVNDQNKDKLEFKLKVWRVMIGLHLEGGNVIVNSAEEDASSTSSKDETNVTTDSGSLQSDEDQSILKM